MFLDLVRRYNDIRPPINNITYIYSMAKLTATVVIAIATIILVIIVAVNTIGGGDDDKNKYYCSPSWTCEVNPSGIYTDKKTM